MRKPFTHRYALLLLSLLMVLGSRTMQAKDAASTALSVFCTPIAVASTPTTENGSVQISIDGATAPFEFILINAFDEIIEQQSFNLNSINFNLTGLAAGSYFLQVTDGSSATSTCDFTIGLAACTMTASLEDVQLECRSTTTDLTVIAENGIAPYSYLWDTGAIEATITGIAAGTYRVTITDDADCVVVVSAEVLSPSTIFLSTTENQAASSPTSEDGQVLVVVNGGTGPYDYTITGLNNQEIMSGNTAILGNNFQLNNFAAGRYHILLTDVSGCSAASNFVISTATCQLNVNVTEPETIYCNGEIAQLDFDISGGVEPYVIAWNTGETEDTLISLSAGDYDFTITDWSGCSTTVSKTIIEPSVLFLSCSVSQQVSTTGGFDGEINFYVEGGVLPYQFEILDANLNVETAGEGLNLNSLVIDGLPASDFILKITDGNDCLITCEFMITEPQCDMTVMVADDDVACFGDLGNLVAEVSGGVPPYSYFWSNAVTTSSASNIPAGDYYVRVTDSNGCRKTAAATIIQPDLLEMSCQILHQGEASGAATGVVFSQITGGTTPYTYQLNNASTQQTNDNILFENLVAQDYTVSVIDAQNCITNCSFNIFPCDVNLDATGRNVTCRDGNDGRIDLHLTNAIEPITYDWNGTEWDGQSSLENLIAGTYSVVVTDGNNCVRSRTIVIKQPLYKLEVSCFLQQDNFGDDIIYYNIDGLHPPFDVEIMGASFFSSENYTIDGNYQVSIPANNPSIHIQVTDALGCSSDCEVDLFEGNCADFSVFAYFVAGTNCSFETAFASVFINAGTPPYAIEWSNQVQTRDNNNILPQTSYTVTVTDAAGCIEISQVFIPAADHVLSAEIESSNLLCENGATTLSAIAIGGEGPYEYYWWSTGHTESTLEVYEPGFYEVTIIDQNNCTERVGVTLTALGFEIEMTDVLINCNESQGQPMLNIIGGTAPFTYQWSNGSTAAQPVLPIGIYDVVVHDANGCMGIAEVEVKAINGDLQILNCPDHIQVTAAAGENSVSVDWDIPVVDYDCPYYLDSNFEPGDIFPIGISVVDYRVADALGEVHSCLFIVEVLRNDLDVNNNTDPIFLRARKKDQVTVLSWFPENETDVLFYEIEKGATVDDIEFLARVDKNEGSKNLNTYLKIDEQPFSGDNYYRLKIHYEDGHFAYSELKVVNHQINDNDLTIFPNPVQDELVVYLPVKNRQMVELNIYNSLGHVVEVLKVETGPQQPTYIDVSRFQKGLYTLTAKVENRRMMVERFVVEQMD